MQRSTDVNTGLGTLLENHFRPLKLVPLNYGIKGSQALSPGRSGFIQPRHDTTEAQPAWALAPRLGCPGGENSPHCQPEPLMPQPVMCLLPSCHAQLGRAWPRLVCPLLLVLLLGAPRATTSPRWIGLTPQPHLTWQGLQHHCLGGLPSGGSQHTCIFLVQCRGGGKTRHSNQMYWS